MTVVVDLWTGERAAYLRTALRLPMQAFAETLGVATRTIPKWEGQPDMAPNPEQQQILDTALAQAPPEAQERFRMLLLGGSVRRNKSATGVTRSTEARALLLNAAGDVAADAVQMAPRLGSEVVDELGQQLLENARHYADRPLIADFQELQRLRDAARNLVDSTRRPSEQARLFATAGGSTALMASIAFDLGNWEAAERLVRAADTYAELSDDTSLIAWVLGLRGTLAFWDDRAIEAIQHIERGLAVAPTGSPRVRLRYIASRAYAILGDASSTARVLEEARADQDDADNVRDALHDEVGGEFEFDSPRAAACAAAAWIQLRHGEESERYASEALDAYLAVEDETQVLSPKHGSYVDIAAARIISGNLDGAKESLAPVLDHTAPRRTISISSRLGKVKRLLDEGRWASDGAAEEVKQKVVQWIESDADS